MAIMSVSLIDGFQNDASEPSPHWLSWPLGLVRCESDGKRGKKQHKQVD